MPSSPVPVEREIFHTNKPDVDSGVARERKVRGLRPFTHPPRKQASKIEREREREAGGSPLSITLPKERERERERESARRLFITFGPCIHAFRLFPQTREPCLLKGPSFRCGELYSLPGPRVEVKNLCRRNRMRGALGLRESDKRPPAHSIFSVFQPDLRAVPRAQGAWVSVP